MNNIIRRMLPSVARPAASSMFIGGASAREQFDLTRPILNHSAHGPRGPYQPVLSRQRLC